MKLNRKILILLVILPFFQTKGQNNPPDLNATLIGELNPSVLDDKILDFDKNIILTYTPIRGSGKTINLINLSFKQLGKIAIKQKIDLPVGVYDDGRERRIYNLLNNNYKILDLEVCSIFIDYQTNTMAIYNSGSERINYSYTYGNLNFQLTGQIFSNEKGEFIRELKAASNPEKRIYQILNKKGELVDVSKKVKNITPICTYPVSLNYDFKKIQSNKATPEIVSDVKCAFNNIPIYAIARAPNLYDKNGRSLPENVITEKSNFVYVDFYKGSSLVYSYSFEINLKQININLNEYQELVIQYPVISKDLKYVLVPASIYEGGGRIGEKKLLVYSLPKIEIEE